MLDKLLDTIGGLTPTIATALGGPLVGAAVGALASAVGIKRQPDETQDALMGRLANAIPGLDMDALAALRKADQDFALKLRELDLEEAALRYADTRDARSREAATGDTTLRNLACIVTAGFLSLSYVLVFLPVPVENDSLLQVLVGALTVGYGRVLTYYFGN